MRVLRLTLVTWLAVLATAASADAGWREVGGPSPLNGSHGARVPEMTTIGGVPYVAYYGWDPETDSHQVHVKRLGLLGLRWHDLGGGTSPINRVPERNGVNPTIAGVGGVPHVAWLEWDGTNYEARVSRFDARSGGWEELVGGPSPINRSSANEAWWLSIADVGGVPYVAWVENGGPAGNQTVRVSRLSQDGSAWEPVGGSIQRDGSRSAYNSRIVAIDGVPWVLWEEEDGTTHQVRVARLTEDGDWEEVGGGPSPINHDPAGYAIAGSIAEVGGVPHVAWSEHDGTNHELRVSRLDEESGQWEEVVGGPSPINHDSEMSAFWTTSLADHGGVPWVTWTEFDGDFNLEARVARLSADGSRWKEVVGGRSPMPHTSDKRAQEASITFAAGLPYVARVEAGPYVEELRVSRLEPDLLDVLAIVNELGATLVAKLRTYGVEFPVEFAYGRGSDLGLRTPVVRTARGAEEDTIVQPLVALEPGATYSWQPTALDGTAVLGPPQSFRIPLPGELPELPDPPDPLPPVPDPPLPDPQDPPDPPDVPLPGLPPPPQPDLPVLPALPELPVLPGMPEVPGLPELSIPPAPPALDVSVIDPSLRVPVGRTVQIRYVTSQAAVVELEVRRGKRLVATAGGLSKAGRNRIAWNGRDRGARAKPGLYTLTLRAKGAGGTAADRARVRVAHRSVARR